MTDSTTKWDIDFSLWGSFFLILSLDLVQPHVGSMGLQLPSEHDFLMGLREYIRTSHFDNVSMVSNVFHWIRKDYSESFQKHLCRWGEDIYAGSSRPDAFLWASIMRRKDAGGKLALESTPEFVRVFRENLDALGERHVDSTVPATDWDRWLFAEQGFDESSNPMDRVDNIIAHVSFVEAWRATVEAVGDNLNFDDIEWWAMQEAEHMGMPLDRLNRSGEWPCPPPAWR